VDRPVELIPLVCPKCGLPVPAEADEVAWVCSQCGQCMLLDEEKGLLPLKVDYSAHIAAGISGRPFWTAQGQVTLKRESYGSSGKENSQAQEFWSQPRTFFIPAYSCTLEALLAAGVSAMQQPPLLEAGPAVAFEPVTLSPQNAAAAADFIVMAIEAGRQDKLKRVEFTLSLSPLSLWILPPV